MGTGNVLPAPYLKPSTFVPTDIASLTSFVDFEDNSKIILGTGSNILSVEDSKDAGTLFSQATQANQFTIGTGPVGRQVAQSTGSPCNMASSKPTLYPVTGPAEIWMVIGNTTLASVAQSRWAFSVGSTNTDGLMIGRRQSAGGTANQSFAMINNVNVIASGGFDGLHLVRTILLDTVTATCQMDGIPRTNTTIAPTGVNTRAVLGGTPIVAPAQNFVGYWSYMICFNALLTDAQANNMYIWSGPRLGVR